MARQAELAKSKKLNNRKAEDVVGLEEAERTKDDPRVKEAGSRSPIMKETRGPTDDKENQRSSGRKPTPPMPTQLVDRLVKYKL